MIRFQANKGQRLKRYGLSVTTTTHGDWCWSLDERRWISMDTEEQYLKPRSSHAPCRTYRAFKRMLRKNPALPKGKIVWINRYIGYNVYA